jgi:hypothetical protein
MSTENPNKCAHPACGSPKQKDSSYCSQSCKAAGGLAEIACHCGHPGCAAERG